MNGMTQNKEPTGQSGQAGYFDVSSPRVLRVDFKPLLPPGKIISILAAINHHALETNNPVVHFTSAYAGEGADTIALETAYTAAISGQKRVLFLDCSEKARGAIKHFRSKMEVTLDQFLKHGPKAKGSPFVMIEGTSLSYAYLGDEYGKQKFPYDTQFSKVLLNKLRDVYDLVVIYSEAGLSTGETGAYAELAGGSILVAQAERIRLPVVNELMQVIQSNGGQVIGTVLNRRRYYIPRWLYALLF